MKKIELTPQKEFDAMAEAVYSAVTADHAQINFSDSANMTARFANNQIIQHVAIRAARQEILFFRSPRDLRICGTMMKPASLQP